MPYVDLILFTGGSCVKNPHRNIKAPYEVVSLHDMSKYCFPKHKLAQSVEVTATSQAVKLAFLKGIFI